MYDNQETVDELRDVLRRNGFTRCDIMACNCGSWHARYGLPERMAEISEILADAGHPLTNENGNLVSNALHELIAERAANKNVGLNGIDCRTCTHYIKNSCWSAMKCIDGSWYHNNGIIQLWSSGDSLATSASRLNEMLEGNIDD